MLIHFLILGCMLLLLALSFATLSTEIIFDGDWLTIIFSSFGLVIFTMMSAWKLMDIIQKLWELRYG